jgi:hypothetical protein
MTDQQTAAIGKDAVLVLENPAFKAAMARIRSEVTEQWLSCPIRDREGQMLLLQLAKLAEKFEGLFVGMVHSGEFAQHKIDIDKIRNESKPRQILRRVVNG